MFSKCRLAISSFVLLPFLFALSVPMQSQPIAHAQADDADCWAVIIGIANYRYLSDLWYSDDDAQELYERLLPIWGEDHILLLIDRHATRADIEDAILDWLDPREDADDTVLLFFSGHADYSYDVSPYDEFDGWDEYILPYDSLPTSYANDIRDDELANWLDRLESENMVIILDTCYSADFIDDLSAGGRVILAACDVNEEAYEDPLHKHSIFTYYILEGLDNLKRVDEDGNFEISAEELFWYAEPETTERALVIYGAEQHPQIDDGYRGRLALAMSVTIDMSPRITSLTVDDTIYSPVALPASFVWAPGSVHSCEVLTTVAYGPGTQYVFSSWSDGNTSPSREISQGGEYRANYITQYYLAVISDYGDPSGEGWYDKSSIATISVTSPVTEPGIRRFFSAWSGDSTATTPTATILMDGPKTVTANWRSEYYLTVISDYGDPQGAGWYDEGSQATISVTPSQGRIIRQVFTGWSGDSTATTPTATIIMDEPKSVTANWRTDYTQLYITIGGAVILAAAASAAVAILVMRRRA